MTQPAQPSVPAAKPTRIWWADFLLAPTITAILGGVVAALLVLWMTPWVAEQIAPPTCDKPGDDLALVAPPDTVEAEATSQEPDPPTGSYSPQNLSDGSTSTVWVPGKEDKRATVTFTLPRNMRIALICIVNGQPNGQAAYLRAGRARTIAVDMNPTDNIVGPPSALKTMPESEMQNRQSVTLDEQVTSKISITILSVYEGVGVVDPEIGPDAYVDPTGRNAIAEVEFYERTA